MENNFKVTETINKDYYLKPYKFVRDLVLGYVNLTKFDLEIIDTIQFQRLKDVRQLTCQQLYPSARHTRFEHSLGVMELTRNIISSLNRNGFLSGFSGDTLIFNEQLQFNAALAALLHDIGHCPFSHLGESEFEKDEVWRSLYEIVMEFPELKESNLQKEFKAMNKNKLSRCGARHEQISCYMILRVFSNILSKVKEQKVKYNTYSEEILYVDYELLIRCILGMPYDVSDSKKFKENKEKNIIVRFINSNIFDIDKLDYIMRDSWFTGIGAPKIDINRLFKNVYLKNPSNYELVFNNRAVSVVQNMIEARDGLYMYVYNHHTVVFSDFIQRYIFRRLAHNERDFIDLVYKFANDEYKRQNNVINVPSKERSKIKESLDSVYYPVTHMGIVSKEYVFSLESIVYQNRSDSDLISLLNILLFDLALNINETASYEYFSKKLFEEIREQLNGTIIDIDDLSYEILCKKYKKYIEKLQYNMIRVYNLIENYHKRIYLKPWWKTNSEFTIFLLNNKELDDGTREKLCNWICQGDDGMDSDEFCSQLAKNVSYITRSLYNDDKVECDKIDLLEPLENDEFFVIRRSAHFFDLEKIGELQIAQKSNEILGVPSDVSQYNGNFHFYHLTRVVPQRDYYSIYDKNSFYIFSKPIDKTISITDADKCKKHYRFIEKVFFFVAKTLVDDGLHAFKDNYRSSKSERKAYKAMYQRFKNECLLS